MKEYDKELEKIGHVAADEGSDDFDDFFEVGEDEQTDAKPIKAAKPDTPKPAPPEPEKKKEDFTASAADFLSDAEDAQNQPLAKDQDMSTGEASAAGTEDEVFGGLEGFEEFLSLEEETATKPNKPSQQKTQAAQAPPKTPQTPTPIPPEQPAKPPSPKTQSAPPKVESKPEAKVDAPKKDIVEDAFEELFADSPKEPTKPKPVETSAPKPKPVPKPETSIPKPVPRQEPAKPSGKSQKGAKGVDTVSDEAFEALFHEIKGPGEKSGEFSEESLASGLGIDLPAAKKKPKIKLIAMILLPILIIGALAYLIVFTKKGLFGISYYSYFIEGYRKPPAEVMKILKNKFEGVKKKLDKDYYPDYISSIKDLKDILSKDTRFIPAHAYQVYCLLLTSGDPLSQGLKKEIEKLLKESEKLNPALNEGIIARAFYSYRIGDLVPAEKMIKRLHDSGIKDPLTFEILGNIAFSRGKYAEAKSNFEKASELNPDNMRVKHSLSMAHYSDGNVEKALEILAGLKSEPNNHLSSNIDWNYIQWASKDKKALAKDNFLKIFNEKGKELSDFDYARLSGYLGDILFEENKLDEAREVLEKGLKKESFNHGLAYRLGLVNLQQGSLDKSIPYFKKAVKYAPKQVAYYIPYAKALRETQKVEQSLEEIEKALQLEPENLEAIFEKGLSLKKSGKNPEALLQFEKILDLNPQHMESLIIGGDIEVVLKQYQKAKKYYDRAVVLNNKDARAHSGLGMVYVGQKNRQLALKEFAIAEKLSPDNVEIILNIGKSFLAVNKLDEAKRNFKRVISIDQNNIEAYAGLGDINFQRKEYEQAAKVYRSAIKVDPKNVDLKVKLAKSLIELKQYKPALDILIESSTMVIDYFPVHLNLGIVYRNLGNMDDSLRELEKSTMIRPDSADAHYEFGNTLMLNAQIPRGLPHLLQAIELNPKHIKTLVRLVDFHYETNELKKAIAYSKKILEVNPKLVKSRLKLAECYRKNGQDKEAFKTYRQVIKQDKYSTQAYIGAGKLLEDNEKFDSALNYYLSAAKVAPKNPQVYYHLGFTYKYLKQKAKAVQNFKKFLKLNPGDPLVESVKEEIFYLTRK